MKIGVVKESFPGERRVALIPAILTPLQKAGCEILVESGAGIEAGIPDEQFQQKGAQIVADRSAAFQSDVVLGVRWAGANSFGAEQDRDLLRRLIVDREIDHAVRREIEDRIWDKITDDAVNLPVDEQDELRRAWDELRDIDDDTWKRMETLPADEWDQIRDQLGDDFTDQDWEDIENGLGEIGDTMDLADNEIESLDEVGLVDLEQDVDLAELDGADLGDVGEVDLGDVVDEVDLGDLSLEAEDTPAITNQCSIFTELEIMHLLMGGRSTSDVAAGINHAMARRVKMLVGRVGVRPEVGMTGGVSKNIGVLKCLEEMLGAEFVDFPQDPQIIGALGADGPRNSRADASGEAYVIFGAR